MKERPILFKAEMVNSILRGRKTQTRRIIKPQPPHGFCYGDVAPVTNGERWAISRSLAHELGRAAWPADPAPGFLCPQGKPGDQLWVRETFISGIGVGGCLDGDPDNPINIIYRADDGANERSAGPWTPSIYMPRVASRIQLEISDIRVERLHNITEKDAIAEGIGSVDLTGTPKYKDYLNEGCVMLDPRKSFASLWASINGMDSWADNPWVWTISFQRVDDK